MTDDLVQRLRDETRDWICKSADRMEAADRIEQMTAEHDRAYSIGYSDAETEISTSALGQKNAFLHSQYAKAADRIEYLTAEVRRWQGLFDEKHRLMLEQKACAEKAEADNARLRNSLTGIKRVAAHRMQDDPKDLHSYYFYTADAALNTGKADT